MAIALALAALIIASPAGAAPVRLPLGHFAGYISNGLVTSLSATVAVPRTAAGSRDGSAAATWIGAQAPGAHGAFIQIGVNEDRVPGPKADYDLAFWSDNRHDFHPVPLFLVAPGDEIAVSLHHVHDGWRLAIVDPRAHRQARFFTRDEAHGAFNWAEFVQEDPVDSTTQLPFRYPHLVGMRFRALRVDYARPARASLLSQWMASARGYLAPSPISGDAFTLHRGHLGSAAVRYLRAVIPWDTAADDFDGELASWSAATPAAQIAAASTLFAKALSGSIAALSRGSWPARVRPLIAAILRHMRAELALIERAPQAAGRRLAIWEDDYSYGISPPLSRVGALIRRDLHAPSLN